MIACAVAGVEVDVGVMGGQPTGKCDELVGAIGAVGHLAALTDGEQTLGWQRRPLGRDAMVSKTPGVEPAAHGPWRHNDGGVIVHLHEMLQTSRMVAVAVGDEDISTVHFIFANSILSCIPVS